MEIMYILFPPKKINLGIKMLHPLLRDTEKRVSFLSALHRQTSMELSSRCDLQPVVNEAYGSALKTRDGQR